LITIRELILFPVIITKAYFKTKYDSLAMSEIRRLKMQLKRKYSLSGGGTQILGMSKKAFFKSIDPGIFNWDATTTKKDEDLLDDDAADANDQAERW
jgi:hypothetical protein